MCELCLLVRINQTAGEIITLAWSDPAVNATSPGRVVSVCYFIVALFQTSFKYMNFWSKDTMHGVIRRSLHILFIYTQDDNHRLMT